MQANVRQFEPARPSKPHPLCKLEEDELDFVLQFTLASGSLKEMAQLYGVSYPTIRITLDRVIDNLQKTLKNSPPDPLVELLAGLVERGEIKPATARSIRTTYQKMLEQQRERSDSHA